MDYQVSELNKTRTDMSCQQEIDSTEKITSMLNNLDNHEHQTHEAILEHQAHLVNFNKQRIHHLGGLREIILMRNRLGDGFAKCLQKALSYDKYLKVINLAGNNISQFGIQLLIKLALIDNNSILGFDARLNPGSTEKTERQLALCMLKNIEKMQQKDLPINENWLKWDLISHGIPPAILKSLGLKDPKDKKKRGGPMRTNDSITKQSGTNSQYLPTSYDKGSIQNASAEAINANNDKGKKTEPIINSETATIQPQRIEVKAALIVPKNPRAKSASENRGVRGNK